MSFQVPAPATSEPVSPLDQHDCSSQVNGHGGQPDANVNAGDTHSESESYDTANEEDTAIAAGHQSDAQAGSADADQAQPAPESDVGDAVVPVVTGEAENQVEATVATGEPAETQVQTPAVENALDPLGKEGQASATESHTESQSDVVTASALDNTTVENDDSASGSGDITVTDLDAPDQTQELAASVLSIGDADDDEEDLLPVQRYCPMSVSMHARVDAASAHTNTLFDTANWMSLTRAAANRLW